MREGSRTRLEPGGAARHGDQDLRTPHVRLCHIYLANRCLVMGKRADRKKFHLLYKTTCTVTGRYYVGMHSTDDLQDGYVGSGKRLRHSISKHGLENHKTEVLELCESRSQLRKREAELVDLERMKDPQCMNLKLGGEGGWDHIDPDHPSHKKASLAKVAKLHSDPAMMARAQENARTLRARCWPDPAYQAKWRAAVAKRRGIKWNHTEEAKRKISEAMKGNLGSRPRRAQTPETKAKIAATLRHKSPAFAFW